jgi:lipid-binding SYLF domain-containing protein
MQGLVFLQSKKTGVIATVRLGSGFVISRIPGTSKWSGPSCLSWNEVGVGLSLGFSTIDTVAVLRSDAAVKLYEQDLAWSKQADVNLVSMRDR